MNASDQFKSTGETSATPHWRSNSLMASLGPRFGTELPPAALPALHWVARSDRQIGRAHV